MSLDAEPFYFPTNDEPVLPVTSYQHCPYRHHWLPATGEFFAGSRDRHGSFRYQTYCRSCTALYRRERYVRLKAAGLWGVKKGNVTQRWCPYGKHWVPPTHQYFGSRVKRIKADRTKNFQPYCIPCFTQYRHNYYIRRRDAGTWNYREKK